MEKPIKALIELPTWLGDTVMSTPAIENIIKHYHDIEITVIGSHSSVEIIKNNEKILKSIVIDKNFKSIYDAHSKLGFYDVYFSFRGSIRAKLLKYAVKAKKKYQFNNNNFPDRHQVEKYVDFVNRSLLSKYKTGNLMCYINKSDIKKTSRLLGINPGASYGSAKRWYPEQFAKVAIELSDSFDIIIFGGSKEKEFAKEIEKNLLTNDVRNVLNLAGKTSIPQLTNYISNLDIFITGDSGPMHIAASLKIPTIALFGPTDPNETSQWKNSNNYIVKKDLECQPCMKRTCPLGHHNCMQLIEANEVINSIPLVYKHYLN